MIFPSDVTPTQPVMLMVAFNQNPKPASSKNSSSFDITNTSIFSNKWLQNDHIGVIFFKSDPLRK